MVIRRFFLSAAALSLIASASVPCLAAPAGGISFTPSLANAKTIQVTETVWEAQNGPTPGPLRQSGTITFRIARPDKFRVEMKSGSPAKVTSSFISDGTTMVGYDGKQTRSQPTDRAEWPFPLMGLLNSSAQGPVSAVPAVRGGRQILLATRTLPTARQERWFDPKTHLLLRDRMFLTWQGKTSEVMRTDYAGWVLDKPLPPALFRVPSAGTSHSGVSL